MRLSTFILCALVVLLTGAALGVVFWIRHTREARIRDNETRAQEALWWISNAEVRFRALDLDANDVHDFWTDDVAGLNYLGTLTGPGRGASMQLIPRELAVADAGLRGKMPEGTRPYHGYFFQAMDVDPTRTPYRQDTDGTGRKIHHASRFAFCAFPEVYGVTGRETFYLNEGRGVLFSVDNRGRPILEWKP